ncbi:hypothetical protein GGH14_003384 [Coemansia sp. RSA 370]|nr:hypothetical protein GGH14_003384 [Coemansia sp. RSA 370]
MEAAEARVSRKIQDLEISNTSLMAVNTQLESRVKTQREQISELKKQLQLNVPYMSDITMDGELPGEMSDEVSAITRVQSALIILPACLPHTVYCIQSLIPAKREYANVCFSCQT